MKHQLYLNIKKIFICILSFVMVFCATFNNVNAHQNPIADIYENSTNQSLDNDIDNNYNVQAASETSSTSGIKDPVYLSDIDYISDLSFAKSGYNIRKDVNAVGGMISLLVDDKPTYFLKGVSAWATSEVVYDISGYQDYDYFSAQIGLDYSQVSTYFAGTASVYIYTSFDGEQWDLHENSDILKMMPKNNSFEVQIPLDGANYLKLSASQDGSDWWDHWYDDVIYGNAMLSQDGYEHETSLNNKIKTVDEYDVLLHEYYQTNGIATTAADLNNEYFQLLLLQRNFVNKYGYDLLQTHVAFSQNYNESFFYIFDNVHYLREFTLGGTPDGAFTAAMKVFDELYFTFKTDLTNETVSEFGIVYKDLYRKMMFTLALTHSATVGFWAGGKIDDPRGPNDSYCVTRYEIFKTMHLDGLLDTELFESLYIEEMRFVMNNIVDDESIEWYNYIVSQNNDSRNPYTYISYMFGYDYTLDKYYSQENYDMWNEKYSLSDFDITYQEGYPKPWIVFEENGVCGAISKTGSNIYGSFGAPSTVVSQPGHAAYIHYSLNSNGEGFWSLSNDISGWGSSGRTEKLSTRMPNGWGTSTTSTLNTNASYILLAQEALNDYENYETSQVLLLQAQLFEGDYSTLETIYRSALEIQDVNFDAWYALASLYLVDQSKTEEDVLDLLREINDALTYQPLPLFDLYALLSSKLESSNSLIVYDLLLSNAITSCQVATDQESIQFAAIKQVANALAGSVDGNIASFSFDGINGGMIILSSKFDGSDVRYDYSVDGGITWHETQENKFTLPQSHIDSINADDDLLIHIIGQNYDDTNIFTIDITEDTGPKNLYNNDLENIVAGAKDSMLWKIIAPVVESNVAMVVQGISDSWTSFSDATPNLTGKVSVMVKNGNSGTTLGSDKYITLNYTDDVQQDPEFSYVSIDQLSIFDYSSAQDEAGCYVDNVIDGNIYTIWHSSYNADDTDRFVVIELDEPIYLSRFEYVSRVDGGTNGRPASYEVYSSLDGENYTLVAGLDSVENSAGTKGVDLETPIATKFVKYVSTGYYGSKSYASASMFNLYEDTLYSNPPLGSIEYSEINPTNKDVTVTLTSDQEITILNNDGSNTYTFSENGTFTFEYQNIMGDVSTSVVSVDYINKETPVASVEYEYLNDGSGGVLAKVVNPSTEITITNNEGSLEYIFLDVGTFTFEFVDLYGNKGSVEAIVNSMGDIVAPTATIKYENIDVGVVQATLSEYSEDIIITNNDGNNTYLFNSNGSFTFEYEDLAGNKGSTTATVDWLSNDNLDDSQDDNNQPNDSTDTEPNDESVNTSDASYDVVFLLMLMNLSILYWSYLYLNKKYTN